MVVLDFSIVNVALPSIRQALGFGGDSVQWVVTAYAITFGGLLVLGGRIADTFGRRSMFVLGLVVFSAASLAAGLATDAVFLVAARAMQGVGSALVAPASLSVITARIAEGPVALEPSAFTAPRPPSATWSGRSSEVSSCSTRVGAGSFWSTSPWAWRLSSSPPASSARTGGRPARPAWT